MGVQESITAGASEIAAVQTQHKQPRFDLDKGGGVIYRAEEGGGFVSMVLLEFLRAIPMAAPAASPVSEGLDRV